MTVKYVGVIGRRASGKGTVAEYLENAYGFEHVMTSKILTREAIELGWLTPIEREDKKKLQELGYRLKKEFGEDVFARLVINNIKPGKKYVIEGTRGLKEQQTYKDTFGDEYYCIGITSPPKTRHERLVKRGQNWSFEEFLQTEQHPIETVIDELMENADSTIRNEGSIQELREKIDLKMQRLGIEKSNA